MPRATRSDARRLTRSRGQSCEVERCPLGQRLVELLLGLVLADTDGEGQLRDQDLAGPVEHALLAGRQALVLVTNRQVPHNLGHLIDVTGLELLDVILVAARPVGRHPRLLLARTANTSS